MNLAEHAQLRELVAQSDAALERLDHYRHLGDAGLERAALRRLRAEHDEMKRLLGELGAEVQDDDSPTEAA